MQCVRNHGGHREQNWVYRKIINHPKHGKVVVVVDNSAEDGKIPFEELDVDVAEQNMSVHDGENVLDDQEIGEAMDSAAGELVKNFKGAQTRQTAADRAEKVARGWVIRDPGGS